MALVDITNKIAAEAKVRAAEVARATAAEVAQIAEQSAQKLTAAKRAKISELDATIASAQKVALSRARRDARSVIDSAQRTMIDDVFGEALAQIAGSDDVKYKQWIGGLLETLSDTERAGIAQVFAPTARVEITKEVCAAQGVDAEIVADDEVVAGMRLESETVAYDMTVERLLGDARSELEPVVAGKLFS